MKRQIPNAISAIRVVLAYPVASYALAGDWLTSFWLLVVGWMSDFFDGFAAKRLGVADDNELGKKWADPIGDAALNVGAYCGLLQGNEKPWVFGLGLILLGVALTLRTLKYRSSSETVRRLSGKASFELVVGAITVLLNVYAYRALHWGPTGIILTIPIQLICRRLKRDRITRVRTLGY